ncbi:MAG: VOC family protein [Thermoleophilaceae bacterium]
MSTATATLPDTLRLGPTHLTVTDLDRSIDFYESVIGMHTQERDEQSATLGAPAEPVLVLEQEPGAGQPSRHCGLYHAALLFPSREELAPVAQRLVASQTPIQGASDHLTHEAFYLPDPDGNGLELAADRERSQWPSPEAMYDMSSGPQPLDVADLMRLVEGQPVVAKAEPGLRTGHLHLHVGNVDEGLAFYRDIVGFDEMANLGSAAFVSAGGYHHHLGFNTWRGEGAGPVPDGVVGLAHWSVQLPAPDVEALRERLTATGVELEDREGGFLVLDPWRNALLVTPA